MTLDANKSTSDASEGPSVLAALVIGNLEAAAAFGLPAEQLRARAGLSEQELADPDSRIPFASYVRLLQAIDATPGSEQFGFLLGQTVSVRALGVVGFAMQHAADVRSAFACLERFRKLMGERVSPIIEELGDHVVFRQTEPPELAPLASLGVAAPVGTLTLLRELSGWSPGTELAVEAAFQFAEPAELAPYRAALGCPLRFGVRETQLRILRGVFDVPLRRADASLFAYLERHASALLARIPDRQPLSAQLRDALLAQLPDGEPQQALLARRLGLSERTLQRRLRGEGTSFAALLDDLRAELARRYLSDPQLCVYEVAYLLGYSEPSPFHRAFRRWTGQTPREYRAERGLGTIAPSPTSG